MDLNRRRTSMHGGLKFGRERFRCRQPCAARSATTSRCRIPNWSRRCARTGLVDRGAWGVRLRCAAPARGGAQARPRARRADRALRLSRECVLYGQFSFATLRKSPFRACNPRFAAHRFADSAMADLEFLLMLGVPQLIFGLLVGIVIGVVLHCAF